MPSCYLLAVCSGSAVDQYTHNASFFNLVERVRLNPEQEIPIGAVLPLEVHAFWRLAPEELERDFQVRLVLVADTGLETPSPVLQHRAKGIRFKTRTMGLPLPPVMGEYTLHIDHRYSDVESWNRQGVSWPLSLLLGERKPRVTH